MSEQGWRQFLAADGVGDWVVLHGGATAVFRVPSLHDAARLAAKAAGDQRRLLARRAWLCPHGERQCRRPAWTQIDGVDASTR